MTRAPRTPTALDSLLAGTLHYGTVMASAIIGLGVAMGLTGSGSGGRQLANLRAEDIVTAGIALFILLPVLRVVLMLISFLRERDYLLSVIAGVVLTIILLGFAVGSRMASAIAG
ncbi:MAG: DUF1634 domain-containing protein [Acidobacteriota bacterium]